MQEGVSFVNRLSTPVTPTPNSDRIVSSPGPPFSSHQSGRPLTRPSPLVETCSSVLRGGVEVGRGPRDWDPGVPGGDPCDWDPGVPVTLGVEVGVVARNTSKWCYHRVHTGGPPTTPDTLSPHLPHEGPGRAPTTHGPSSLTPLTSLWAPCRPGDTRRCEQGYERHKPNPGNRDEDIWVSSTDRVQRYRLKWAVSVEPDTRKKRLGNWPLLITCKLVNGRSTVESYF